MTNEDTIGRLNAALSGRYRIERELGRGGMATVYLAEDVRHHRRVAVKVLQPELAAVVGAERFLAEIETTARLQHPHILPLFDSGATDGFLFYVMPYVDGESLRDRLRRERQLPVDEALRIATEIADALDYAHRRGIVHRDVKPGNVLLHEGRVQVADFGIARAVSAVGSDRLTETGLSVGTPDYMSPEQAMADESLDARADVYALGCVLYEMLAGEPPHAGPTSQAVLASVLTSGPPDVRSRRGTVPLHVASAVAKSLERLPADRFSSASDFARALGDSGFRHGVPAARAAGSRTNRVTSVLPWAAVAVVVPVAVWAWLGMPDPEPLRPVARTELRLEGLGDLRSSATSITLSPDGRFLVYGTVARGPLVTRPMDALQARAIPGTEAGYNPFVSPDGGTIGFLRGGDVVAVPAEGGASRVLTDGMGVVASGQPDWTPDGGVVFTATTRGGGPEGRGLILAAPGARPDTLTRPEAPIGHVGPTVLPGGAWVLYTAVGLDLTQARIERLSLRSRETTTLLTGGVSSPRYADGHLFWVRADGMIMVSAFDPRSGELVGDPAPLGDRVRRTRFGGTNYDVAEGVLVYVPPYFTRPVEWAPGGETRALSSGPETWHHPRYSPDGSQIVLDRVAVNGGRDVWTYTLTSSTLTRVTHLGDAHDPTWLPDGRHVSFFSFSAPDGPLMVTRADGSAEARGLPLGDAFPHEALVNPGAWFPDGTAYVGGVEPRGRPSDLWIVFPDGWEHLPLTRSPYSEEAPAISPDAAWIAYQSDESGRWELYLRPADGSAGRLQVSNAGGTEPVWDPTGERLYYLEVVEGRIRFVGADLRMTPSPRIVSRTVLDPDFRGEESTNHANYDIHPSGDRFILIQREPGTSAVAVFGWRELVRDALRATGGR